MNWLGGQKESAERRSGIITVLDIGSSKVCCIVAKLKPSGGDSKLLRMRTHRAQVIGIGHQKSHGVKSVG
jgi:cell division protein FtsA